ncbi:MAG TPA: ZIP family zinc transporter [Actinophytocola sp.]|uniref:ZIP family metal transporter n=1 Tax=Actinophytocola sp. TaxID=1872138 RepID=UPI002DDD3A8E|nr:ZIP family zinc transporter [Actinophytocola sp.]HEV2781787.1 ZIP family zinc transporter [Actinophytocola sp.]
MLEATLWGLLGGSSLVLGGVLGLFTRWSPRAIALVMAFGSGVLFSSVAFDLVAESWVDDGGWVTGTALAAGAAVFFGCDLWVSRTGVPRRRRATADHGGAAAMVIVVGAALDGIPESAAIGATLLDPAGISAAFVLAVFLSNIPESLSSSVGLRRAGHGRRAIVLLWAGIAVLSALAAGVGYLAITGMPHGLVGAIKGFAAGAVLTMIASTMLPEAHERGGPPTALVTTAGFLVALIVGGPG